MAKIILKRTSEFINILRNYGVYIDGRKVGNISNSETKELNITPGQHSIIAKIDWCSSPTLAFEIKDDEIKSFKVGGFKNAYWFMPTFLIIIILSYLVYWNYNLSYLFYLIILGFLILVYYLTAGRKKYLTLTEIKTELKEEHN